MSHRSARSLTDCFSPDGGGGKAVTEGGGGSRKGPAGQPGQLNGMPSKKSHSTSKLSGKGEQGKYQTGGLPCMTD